MSKTIKRILIIVAVLGVGAYVATKFMKSQTKQASPEVEQTYTVGDLTAVVHYCRPSKKGRVIFGSLVPYGKVWRTGANEATTISFSEPITFGGTAVPAGTYTLWSTPGADQWSVYLNKKMYGWGIDFDGNAMRDPMEDVAVAKVIPKTLTTPAELFTIGIAASPATLVMEWDLTHVEVPLDQ
ncbi:MAG: DUF2911 domain-containing protein [Flavobacteriales bacterium]|nr:DUF2911 domain-containing protein [Flavobacteriales bacterium]